MFEGSFVIASHIILSIFHVTNVSQTRQRTVRIRAGLEPAATVVGSAVVAFFGCQIQREEILVVAMAKGSAKGVSQDGLAILVNLT